MYKRSYLCIKVVFALSFLLSFSPFLSSSVMHSTLLLPCGALLAESSSALGVGWGTRWRDVTTREQDVGVRVPRGAELEDLPSAVGGGHCVGHFVTFMCRVFFDVNSGWCKEDDSWPECEVAIAGVSRATDAAQICVYMVLRFVQRLLLLYLYGGQMCNFISILFHFALPFLFPFPTFFFVYKAV